MFPSGDRLLIPEFVGWATDCFTGRFGDYQAIDALYHDFEHTLQGTLCLARLLQGRHSAGAQPAIEAEMFHLALLAMLFHDTGYLKKRNDDDGTGAKYTITHVDRSADFAAQLLTEKRFAPTQIRAVQNMIRCTGINADLAGIAFQSETERVLGAALATADLLGQMAADDYVEKLPVLYSEFAEAVEFSGDLTHFVASFRSAEDLIQRTPSFWTDFVLRKLAGELGGLYRFLNDPYPSGPNYYLERVSHNMKRLQDGCGGGAGS
jgi:predicted metal-dependent HD superfamily phosphohydrolase